MYLVNAYAYDAYGTLTRPHKGRYGRQAMLRCCDDRLNPKSAGHKVYLDLSQLTGAGLLFFN